MSHFLFHENISLKLARTSFKFTFYFWNQYQYWPSSSLKNVRLRCSRVLQEKHGILDQSTSNKYICLKQSKSNFAKSVGNTVNDSVTYLDVKKTSEIRNCYPTDWQIDTRRPVQTIHRLWTPENHHPPFDTSGNCFHHMNSSNTLWRQIWETPNTTWNQNHHGLSSYIRSLFSGQCFS